MDYVDFERRLLCLMFRTNTPLVPVHIAYHLDIPIAEAKAHLDDMVTAGVLELDSDDGGHLVYGCPARPPTDSLPAPRAPRRRRRRNRNRRAAPQHHMIHIDDLSTPPVPRPRLVVTAREPQPDPEDRRYSAAAAAALSFFLPGVGQIYSGRVPQGIGWMIATGLGYLLFLVPGLILHICCIVNAAAVPSTLPQLVTSSPSAR